MPGLETNKTQIVILVVGLVCIGLIVVLRRADKARSQAVMAQCWQIGRELVAHTNSTLLSSIQPTLQRRLGELLSASARVEDVRLGDEPRLPDELKATARLYLVNARRERVVIRVQQEFKSDKYRVVGFWFPHELPPSERP